LWLFFFVIFDIFVIFVVPGVTGELETS